jgi:ribonuclease HI
LEEKKTRRTKEWKLLPASLESLKKDGIKIDLYSDSAYVVNCMNHRWFETWLKNGWKNAKKKPVENQDLWMQLLELLKKYKVTFHKVEGHSGDPNNERADKLAQKGIIITAQ